MDPDVKRIHDEIQGERVAELPYYLCVRGDEDTGYQTILADTAAAPASVLLVFSTEERATAFLREREMPEDDWSVGQLASWRAVVDCLGAYESVQVLCMDPDASPESNARVYDAEKLIAVFGTLAEAEGEGNDTRDG